MKKSRKVERMDKPEDTLAKRQAAYAADVIHEYHRFPGTYAGPCVNEYPNALKGVPRTDSTYFVYLNGVKCVMNVEDESTHVDHSTMVKIDTYRVNIEYGTKLPVINAITTPIPIEKCKRTFEKSPTLTLAPIIKSYSQIDGSERLINISSKINSNEILSNVEAMDLIMIPKMFTAAQEEILEKVCDLLKRLRIEDETFKMELILEIRCVIHKYAKTLEDIERLEGVIGLQKVMTAREFQDQLLIEQGRFLMALRIMDEEGIDKAVKISGFSREELENRKMNNKY